ARRIEALGREWNAARAWGVRDRGQWVGTLRSERRSLTVPGAGDGTAEVWVDAVTNVTVAGTHRRRGLMTRMLDGSLRAARDRGDPISILIAAEWPIYGRFGYAPATLSADYVLRRSRPGATCAGDSTRVRQVEIRELGELAPRVYAAARRRRAGQIDRYQPWWNRVLGLDGYTAFEDLPQNWFVHEGDAGPDGLLGWKPNGHFGLIPPLATVEAWDLTSANDVAYQNLWSYLSGIDGIDHVNLPNRPVDEPIRWLLADARTLVLSEQFDFLWLRLLDVPVALAARRYAVADEIVLQVVDEQSERFAQGRYRLRADGEVVSCERTAQDADVEITQLALASIYLGGFRVRQLLLTGGLRERTPGALGRLDLLFSTPLAPWNGTSF
ncbi:MAG: GNAT family N-acetyltransferase, partial [Solirubrobacteraceae bacterium]